MNFLRQVRRAVRARAVGPPIGRLAVCLALAIAPTATPSAPERAEQLVQTALALDKDVERGARLYVQHCAGCHGERAHGDQDQFIPALAAQRQAYLVKQLADFAELEREAPQMHNVVSRPELTEPQAWADLAAYLNALPPPQFVQTGDGAGLDLGEAIFREQCASCHEEDARGDDEGFVPSLRNQHYAYLLRQMRALGTWHRLNVDPDLVRFLDSLQAEEITALADYLSRLHGPVRDRLRMHQDGTVGD